LQKEFQQEREDMLETIRDLRKEVKLVCLTIENFIPMEHYQQIVERAHYDESTDEWVISNIEISGNRIRPKHKRVAENPERDANAALLRGNPENQDQNAEMLMNERPNVYFVYTEDGGAQRAEARTHLSPTKQQKNQRMKSAGRPGTASRKGRPVKSAAAAGGAMPLSNFLHSPDPEEDDGSAGMQAFPKARGLVKSQG
jgi:kinesin family protein 3/17